MNNATANSRLPQVVQQNTGVREQYLTFTLDGEMFAIPIRHIKEIIEYSELTEVPMMPRVIRGVINLRGSVVPVVDLSVRFGRRASQTGRRSCIVIIETDTDISSQYIGVIVDAVNEVLEIDQSDIEPAPAFGARVRSDFIQAMGKIGAKFIIMLDVTQVLSLDEISQFDEAQVIGRLSEIEAPPSDA